MTTLESDGIFANIDLLVLSHGSLTHVHPYLLYFRERGHSVTWATLGTVAGPPSAIEGVEVTPVAPDWPGREQSLRKVLQLRNVKALRALLRERKPDLVHAHFLSSAGLLALLAGATPLAVTVHGSDLTGRMPLLRKLVARAVSSRAALLNPVSAPLELALRGICARNSDFLVATLGIELDSLPFDPKPTLQEEPRLLCTRSLEDVYDPATIVEAVDRLRRTGLAAKLTFAAGGSLSDDLKQRVSAAGLEDAVRFLGGFSASELPGLFQSHDLYVSASHRDGTSLSLLEAMASGIYPVVSRIPANQAWLTDAADARLFEPGNVDALASAVRAALAEPRPEAALAANRARVERDGDRLKNFERLEKSFVALRAG